MIVQGVGQYAVSNEVRETVEELVLQVVGQQELQQSPCLQWVHLEDHVRAFVSGEQEFAVLETVWWHYFHE